MRGPAIASHNAMSAIRTAARRSGSSIIILGPRDAGRVALGRCIQR